MENIWALIGTLVVGSLLPMLIGLVVSLITKGKFESWGIICGKSISYFGSVRLGKATWEKIEDAVLIALVSFVQGVKKGADVDDIDIEKIETSDQLRIVKKEVLKR